MPKVKVPRSGGVTESEARARAYESAFKDGVKEGIALCVADIRLALDDIVEKVDP